ARASRGRLRPRARAGEAGDTSAMTDVYPLLLPVSRPSWPHARSIVMSRGLRIGVVLSGQLVEERFVRTGPITLGHSLRATISVPLDGVPREHVLFGPDLALSLAPAMTGRIAVAGEVADAGNGPLARGARGKLQLGELAILFQDVESPPLAPRPRLPASLR